MIPTTQPDTTLITSTPTSPSSSIRQKSKIFPTLDTSETFSTFAGMFENRQVFIRKVQWLLPGPFPRDTVLFVGTHRRRFWRSSRVPGLPPRTQPSRWRKIPRSLFPRATTFTLRQRIPLNHQCGHYPTNWNRSQRSGFDRESAETHWRRFTCQQWPRRTFLGKCRFLCSRRRNRQIEKCCAFGRSRKIQGSCPKQLHISDCSWRVDTWCPKVRETLWQPDGNWRWRTNLYHSCPIGKPAPLYLCLYSAEI